MHKLKGMGFPNLKCICHFHQLRQINSSMKSQQTQKLRRIETPSFSQDGGACIRVTFPTLGWGVGYNRIYKYLQICKYYIYIYIYIYIHTHTYIYINMLLLFSHLVVSDSLRPYGLQHTRTKRYKYRKIPKQLLEELMSNLSRQDLNLSFLRREKHMK